MRFECKWIMDVDNDCLLEIVNDYQESSDEPTFNTLDDIPEDVMIDALYSYNYIEDEINDYMTVEDVKVTKLDTHEKVSNTCFY